MQVDGQQRLHARVYGRVQGVFYRDSTRTEALCLGLTGWVRNLNDGSVEMVAEGPADALEQLAGWLRTGPPLARVTDVQLRWENATGAFDTFKVHF